MWCSPVKAEETAGCSLQTAPLPPPPVRVRWDFQSGFRRVHAIFTYPIPSSQTAWSWDPTSSLQAP